MTAQPHSPSASSCQEKPSRYSDVLPSGGVIGHVLPGLAGPAHVPPGDTWESVNL